MPATPTAARKNAKSAAREPVGEARKQTRGRSSGSSLRSLLREEMQIPAIWISALLFLVFGKGWLAQAASSTPLTLALFGWLFVAILWGAFGVVRHAEYLATKLGEPYGTLILTLSVTIIEVAFIVTAVVTATGDTTVVRDAVFAVVMLMLNGTVGLCLLLGGLRHHEQDFNLPGARAFLSVAIPLAAFSLVLPNFTVQARGPVLSPPQATVIAILILLLYAVFLAIQTKRHRSFFVDPRAKNAPPDEEQHDPAHVSDRSVGYHAALLVATLLPAVYLTEELGQIVERAVAAASLPREIVGIIVAVLVLSPEIMGALQATLRNQLQRAVNISLGSVLATIGLTVPAVLTIGLLMGKPIVLGVGPESLVLLGVTFLVSVLTFGGERTTMLQGAVHLVMFVVFLTLIFHP